MFIRTTPRVLTTTGLSAVIFTIASDPSRWRPHVRFTSERRYWTRLPAPEPFIDSIDVWLLNWLPDQGTALHDHGDAGAAFRVVQGELLETRWDDGLQSRRMREGQAGTVEPGVLHDVANPFHAPAVSIHAYSPRLRTMTYYGVPPGGQPVVDRVVVTDEPEGARP